MGRALVPVRPCATGTPRPYTTAELGYAVALVALHESSPAGRPKPRLLDRVRATLGTRHDSRRTEEAYAWIDR